MLLAIMGPGLGLVPRYTSYPVAPLTDVQVKVTEVVVSIVLLAGAVLEAQPGIGVGIGAGSPPLFLLQELRKTADTTTKKNDKRINLIRS
jgi:hypothetical protein